MVHISATDATVQVMQDEGVEFVFGIPGAAILPLYQSILKSGKIRHYTVRHEEGGTHAADGYARATGKVGVMLGTSGPAGTNMLTGLYTATADSIPLICITGQAQTHLLHKEAFQAVDIVGCATPVTKWSVMVKEPAQMPWVFREAFRIAQDGRPGAVLIDLPIDVQRGMIEYEAALTTALPRVKPAPTPAAIDRALGMLLAAKRPLLMLGGGVIGAEATQEFRALAEYLHIPVTITLMGKGGFPEDHPLYAGMAGIQTQTRYGNQIFLESDLVVAIGARFADRHTGDINVYRGERTFIQIDIDPKQIGRVFTPDMGIVSDAKLALQALLAHAHNMPRREPTAWAERVTTLRETLERRMDFDETPIKPPRAFKEINEYFDRDTIFVTAIGLYQIWSGQFQHSFQPRHYLVCGQAGPLGWEISACTGVKLGQPDKQVVGIVGDYSFQFLIEEIAVAVQYRVPFVLVMLNNGYLGLIRQSELSYDMNFGVDISYIGNNADGELSHMELGMDHVKVMEAMGGLGRKVERPEEIHSALAWATRESATRRLPILVEIMIEREANAAMGQAINAIKEFEPLPTPREQAHALSHADVTSGIAVE
ncbi:MAG TPA: glyoxylate carboligase [Ktedonobacteraceae bacterium]|jgi:tartronate-semialdehyde synthase|nr:glyoxylate carboligase [Ktedonobacteraceae bacterium]